MRKIPKQFLRRIFPQKLLTKVLLDITVRLILKTSTTHSKNIIVIFLATLVYIRLHLQQKDNHRCDHRGKQGFQTNPAAKNSTKSKIKTNFRTGEETYVHTGRTAVSSFRRSKARGSLLSSSKTPSTASSKAAQSLLPSFEEHLKFGRTV